MEQQILIMFGGLAVGGVLASLLMFWVLKRRKAGGDGDLDEQGYIGDDPLSVDGTGMDV